jgi:hypothetical protein
LNLRSLCLACLLCAAAPCSCWPLFGFGPGKRPLLWVPEQSKMDWDAFRALLAKYPDARFTVGLAPEEIPEGHRKWLAEEVKSGRLEVALRIPGDPVLPLIHRYRERDVIDRLALGRAQYKQVFDASPAGLVPGDGAVSTEVIPFLERQGLRWCASGGGGSGFWQSAGGLAVVPFQAPASTQPAPLLDAEAAAPVLSGVGVETLEALFGEGGTGRWAAVASSLPQVEAAVEAPDSWPTWSGGLDAWTSLDGQKRAWDLYSRTAQALRTYQDSGLADINTLNAAIQYLYAAQSSRYFTPQGVRAPAVMKEFQGRLGKVYRLLRVSPPKAMASGSQAEKPAADKTRKPSEEGEDDASIPSGLRSGREAELLWFENPEGSSAALPEQPPRLAAGATAQDLWTPVSLQVGWSEKTVDLVFQVKRLVNVLGAPNGFDSLMIDLYIDMNHLPGRGATVLLPGRSGFVRPIDAWEYAIVATGWTAALYRPQPGHAPVPAASLQARGDVKAGKVAVSIPRSKLRGNPALWGYLLLTSATDRERAQRTPPDGTSPVLGLLGPLDVQERLLKPGRRGYHNFTAVRLEE